ncbi:VCBS repeat-containing protein [bacterium]|nr:VCBS repeat-containing protein [candidate division CSSED10-310 bacterium]
MPFRRSVIVFLVVAIDSISTISAVHGRVLFPDARIDYRTGFNPVDLLLGDLDADGDTDVLVVEMADQQLGFYANDGTGGLSRSTVTVLPPAPLANQGYHADCADFDEDGIPDVALSCQATDQLIVLTGDGAGAFINPALHSTASMPRDLWCGDVDMDGDADIVVLEAGEPGDMENTLAVFKNNGAGLFGSPTRWQVAWGPAAMAAADFNGDGFLDICVTYAYSRDMTILLNNHNGGFPIATNYDGCLETAMPAAGDLDGDGHPDVVVADRMNHRLAVYLNAGNGFFPAEPCFIETNQLPCALAFTDYDLDGDPDLLVASEVDEELTLFDNDGNASFTSSATIPIQPGFTAMLTRDLDGDGIEEMLWTDEGVSMLSVIGNDGAGGFRLPGRYPAGDIPLRFCHGDVNGDGSPDVLVANSGSNDLSLLINDGAGGFTEETRYDMEGTPYELVMADFNEDGFADAVVTNAFRPLLFLSDGQGFTVPTDIGGASELYLLTADFNDDGKPDLASSSWESNFVTIRLARGDGSFDRTTWGVAPHTAIRAGDVNSDGAMDLVLRRDTGYVPQLMLNDGTGSFSITDFDEMPLDQQVLAVADLDMDGCDDVVMALIDSERLSGTFWIYYNDGSGGFSENEIIPNIPHFWGYAVTLAFAQVDGENGLDILVPTSAGCAWFCLSTGPRTHVVDDRGYGFGTGIGMLGIHPAATGLNLLATETNSSTLMMLHGGGLPDPTPTPPPTATATPAQPADLRLLMTITEISSGDLVGLSADIRTTGQTGIVGARVFVFLDLGLDTYWFWPAWVMYPPSIDCYTTDMPAGFSETLEVLTPFTWPDGAGSMSGSFIGGITDNEMLGLISPIDQVDFYWRE